MAKTKQGKQAQSVKEGEFPIVGIGASAGGLNALNDFFDAVPEHCGMAFVVVVHLSPDHASSLAELLQVHTSMKVMQVKGKTKMKPDHVYIIPPKKVLKVTGGHVELTKPAARHDGHTTIDLFFRSLAEYAKDGMVAIVLSGTGSDGTLGLKAVKEDGGVTMVQDPGEAQHDGMPRSAIRTGLVDVVLPVRELARKLADYRDTHSRIKKITTNEKELPEEESETLERILKQVSSKTGHDFIHYKRSSVLRRIKRRLQVTRNKTLPGYLSYMEEHSGEVQELFKDLLISVTNFFRDPEAFEALKKKVIPSLFEEGKQENELRVWVPGCATGEEVWSIAMLLQEYAAGLDHAPNIQIFATDIDQKALAMAREGVYPDSISASLGPGRLQRWFVKESSGYRIRQELQEMVLFAVHDLLRDPPFTRLNLVSCRNLLIYLDREMQSEIFNLLHYALHDEAYLFLGLSDSNLEAAELFSVVDKKHRIYLQRAGSQSRLHLPHIPLLQHMKREPGTAWKTTGRQKTDVGNLHRSLLARQYAPASVIINRNHDVIHSEGDIGGYLQYKTGEPSSNILEMAVPELRRELRSVLFRFNQTGGQETVKKQVRIGAGEKRRITDVLLHPVEEHNFPGGFLQVVFRNVPTSGETADTGGEDRGETRADSGKESDLVGELEKELRFTKEQLQVNTEQYETSIEELRASNEELQSLNEELQSTTEELETSKEEIQSVNEELKMVNEELESKVKKLNRANSDMKNLMETTEIGILFVGNDLHLQLYTESVTSLFNLIESDIGRPLDHVTHRLDNEDLTRDVSHMLDTLKPVEKIVQSEKEWYMMRLRPYRNTEEEVDGAVISFMNITQIKQAQHTIVVRTRQQEAAASLGLYMLTNREMQKIMDKTVQVLHKELDVDYSRLMKLNAEDDTLVTKAGLGWEKEDLVDFSLSAAKKWDAGYALKTKKPVITTDYTSEDRFEQPPVFVELGIQSGMNVLIEGIGGSYGILSVYSKSPRTFEENEIAFIQLVANSLGGAIEWERSNQRLLEEIEQTRKLQHQIVKISTSERWEVGKYLHDNVAQNLVAAQMIFSSLDGKFKGNDGKEMDKLDQLLKKTIDDIRSLSHEMIPMDIKSKGLDYTLQHFAKHMQELFDLECTFKLDGSEKLIQNNYAATNLFNITREATKNAAMHGKATKVVIEITREGDHLKLAVKDNGNGLDDEYEHKDGMGINIMRHRAHLMSGSLEIERVSEKDGVLVTCLIPLTVLQAEDEQAISTSNR